MNCLLLSTPDRTVAPLLDALSSNFDCIAQPTFNQLEQPANSDAEIEIHRFHRAILQGHQKQWYQPLTDTKKVFEAESNRNQLNSILSTLGQSNWLVHDPLLAYFLPNWLTAEQQFKIIFSYSSPMHCALSLQNTWRFPIAFGLALWENYVLSAAVNLHQLDHTLISLSKLKTADKSYFRSIARSLSPLVIDDLSTSLETHDRSDDFVLPGSFQVICDLLENHELGTLAARPLSSESRDILEFYGQLRAGYQHVQTERDHLRLQLLNSVQDNDTSTELVQPHLTNDAQLVLVKVHIEGMEVVEFYADPSSPVLDMLRSNLVNSTQDQLLYLSYGEEEHDTLYFMSSSLLALEIKPAEQH